MPPKRSFSLSGMTPDEIDVLIKTPEGKDKFLRALSRTPEGRAKITTSLYRPMMSRWSYRSIARKLLCDNHLFHRSVWVPSKEGVVSADTAMYSGEVLEGEEVIKGSSLWEAFERAQRNIVNEVVSWETTLFLQLLHGLPRHEVLVGDFDKCLDEIKKKVVVRGIVLDSRDPLVQAAVESRDLAFYRSVPYEHRNVQLFFNRDIRGGERWVLGTRAGFQIDNLEFEVLPFRLKWKATLQLGIGNPKEVFQCVAA